MATYTDLLSKLKRYSEANGNTPLEHTAGIIIMHEHETKAQQLTAGEKREAHNVYAGRIADLFSADPDANLDPAEIVATLGMPDKQGSRSFVRFQLKQLRLTYQQSYAANGATAAAAD